MKLDARVSIIITKSDSQEAHRAAFYIEFSDATNVLIDIDGSGRFLSVMYEENINENPKRASNIIDVILVGILKGVEKEALKREIVYLRPDSQNRHKFIGEAMDKMARKGWITQEEKDMAVRRMSETILEAYHT